MEIIYTSTIGAQMCILLLKKYLVAKYLVPKYVDYKQDTAKQYNQSKVFTKKLIK